MSYCSFFLCFSGNAVYSINSPSHLSAFSESRQISLDLTEFRQSHIFLLELKVTSVAWLFEVHGRSVRS